LRRSIVASSSRDSSRDGDSVVTLLNIERTNRPFGQEPILVETDSWRFQGRSRGTPSPSARMHYRHRLFSQRLTRTLSAGRCFFALSRGSIAKCFKRKPLWARESPGICAPLTPFAIVLLTVGSGLGGGDTFGSIRGAITDLIVCRHRRSNRHAPTDTNLSKEVESGSLRQSSDSLANPGGVWL
jgi:hypothetical protein